MLAMAEICSELQRRKGQDRALLIAFGIAFMARLLERVAYAFSLAGRKLDFTTNFGITEWLINYAGGFQRRGLPGSLFHVLYQRVHLSPNASVIITCLLLYLVFSIYLWRTSAGIVPRWVLLTTPLLGYPVFIDRILIRKDILILLLFALSVRIICSHRTRLNDFIASLALAIGILSHELIAFIALPTCALLILLREYVSRSNDKKADGSGNLQQGGVMQVAYGACSSLVWLLLPLTSFIAILWFRGTDARAQAIALSWKSAFDPRVPFKGPQGSIAWLPVPSEKYISDSQGVLKQLHFGIPFWLILVLASISGVVLLAAVIGRQSRVRAWFFVAVALIQFLFMAPIFFHSWDHGRWVILCLMSAFVLAIETPLAWQAKFAALSKFPQQLRSFILPGWIAPLGLAFWGIEIVSWSPYSWLANAPVGLFLQIYFYLRILGMPHSL